MGRTGRWTKRPGSRCERHCWTASARTPETGAPADGRMGEPEHSIYRWGLVNITDIRKLVEQAHEGRAALTPDKADAALKEAVEAAIGLLDRGEARVAEKQDGKWVVNEWLKKAVLLYFRLHPNQVMDDGTTRYYDKVPLKYSSHDAAAFARDGARVVPHAVVRRGAYIGPDVVLMPSYVNLGAYVGQGTMVDTWATNGSCAQIGKNVHISGGAGIGGVLEPLQAGPVIIEDNCFVGARSEVA